MSRDNKNTYFKIADSFLYPEFGVIFGRKFYGFGNTIKLLSGYKTNFIDIVFCKISRGVEAQKK